MAFPATGRDIGYLNKALDIAHTPPLRTACIRASGLWDGDCFVFSQLDRHFKISDGTARATLGKLHAKWDWLSFLDISVAFSGIHQ